jgi:hypothetical protein
MEIVMKRLNWIAGLLLAVGFSSVAGAAGPGYFELQSPAVSGYGYGYGHSHCGMGYAPSCYDGPSPWSHGLWDGYCHERHRPWIFSAPGHNRCWVPSCH